MNINFLNEHALAKNLDKILHSTSDVRYDNIKLSTPKTKQMSNCHYDCIQLAVPTPPSSAIYHLP
jgi:hypothetical protein